MCVKDYSYVKSLLIWFGIIFSASVQADNNTLIWANADQPWEPIFYQNELGEYTGLSYDMIKLVVEDKLNMNLEVNLFPWKRSQEMVRRGEADFMITLVTDTRLEYADPFETTLYSLYFQIYTYKDHPRLEEIKQIKSIDDIRRMGLKTVSNAGNNWHKSNVEEKGIFTTYVSSDVKMVRFLASKRADIIIDTPYSINTKMVKAGLQNEIKIIENRINEVKFKVLFSRNSRHYDVFEQFKKALVEADEKGEFHNIRKTYMFQ